MRNITCIDAAKGWHLGCVRQLQKIEYRTSANGLCPGKEKGNGQKNTDNSLLHAPALYTAGKLLLKPEPGNIFFIDEIRALRYRQRTFSLFPAQTIITTTLILSFRRLPQLGLTLPNACAGAGEIYAEDDETNRKNFCTKGQHLQFLYVPDTTPRIDFSGRRANIYHAKMKMRQPAKWQMSVVVIAFCSSPVYK